MKQKTRKALAFATVPLVGVFVLGPSFASAEENGRERKTRIEDRIELREERRDDRKHRREDRRSGFLLDAHGKHRGWMNHSEEAKAWSNNVFTSIKESDYNDFKDVVSGTPLETETDKDTFEQLSLASDRFDAGKREEAREIMKELRDTGYRFKKLFRDSVMKLFPKDS